jgi:cell fate regulator YaaT (PSP1 superfamily)
MSQIENIKPKAPKNVKQMLVRYGRLGLLGWFEHHEVRIPRLNSHVVIKTERGLELGEVVGIHSYRAGQFKSSPEQVEQYYVNRTKDYPLGEGGAFVRFATRQDLHEQEHLEKNAVGEAKCCQRIADELGLNMRIIEAEHLFGGERIVFYFTSETRVDFRDLVKRLAKEYQTRIELRQIGSRDEARLISDYETCGQQCCCSRFLKILEPVNMRMAKLQKATLDPSKISGHCGRLKCCLRYEDQTYLDLKRRMPHRGTVVKTPKGIGKIADMQILTQLVVVQMDSGDRQAWPLDELQILKPGELEQRMEEPEQDDILQERLQVSDGTGQDADVTEELLDIAEAEQDQTTEEEVFRPQPNEGFSANRSADAVQRQNGSDQGSRRNKNRRRRSKNKNRGPQNNSGGPAPQNSQPWNEQNRPNKPSSSSNGNASGPAENNQ